jgi:plastocyanin
MTTAPTSVRTCLAFFALAGCAATLAACGGGSSGSGGDAMAPAVPMTTAAAPAKPAAPSSAAVTLKDISFKPETVTIARGGTVRWTWKDGDVPHNVTFAARHSTTKHDGGTYKLTFKTAGTFKYECTIHPGMVGKVIVK